MKKTSIIIICFAVVLVLSVFIYAFVEFISGELGYQLILDFTNYSRVDYQLVESSPEDTNLQFLNKNAKKQLVKYMKENNLLIEPNNYSGKLLRTSPFEDLLDVLVFIKDPNLDTHNTDSPE